MTSGRSYQVSAVLLGFTAIAHTVVARNWQKDPQFQKLPKTVRAFARAGWYQGSFWLAIMSLVNYQWSTRAPATRLSDPFDRLIALLQVIALEGSAWWYNRNGIRDTGAVVGIVGLVQAYAAFFQ